MIPPTVSLKCLSEGEREVFRRLRDEPETSSWLVLHSLTLAEHAQQVAGEVDFVVIIPQKGVLCIEVKGCSTSRLRREGGMWFYGPGDKGDSRSPFSQASQAMYSLRGQLLAAQPSLRGVQFSSGVIFPFARFTERSVEWNDWEVIDSRALRSAPISRLLERLMDNARAHLGSHNGPRLASDCPSPQQCGTIRDTLRGNFEVINDRRVRASVLDTELRRYTTEQFSALDAMEENPQTLFAGPAGTGKTLLAIEAACRSRDAGKRVLLVCYNRLLGSWLQSEAADLMPEVSVSTLHRHMLSVAALGMVPDSADQTFWESRLPDLACNRLLEVYDGGEERLVFDELIVDEAQDILRDSYLDFLDLSTRGGLAGGRWKMFGDFTNQAIYGTANLSLDEFRQRRANRASVFSLRVNCRNTPAVAEWVHILAGLRPPYLRVLRPDNGVHPELRFFKEAKDQAVLVSNILVTLDREGYSGKDVVLLSPHSDALCAAASIVSTPWRDRLRPFDPAQGGWIRYGSIHAFKGLEARAIVVTDIETIGTAAARNLFYVAMTRSLERLVILANERVRAEAIQMLNESR